ncbi:hypothetical protein [Synechococcus sp. KORDI-52]|uniref:hypothetical protein n=1 Tax=Synechococcus sp. KORDI-52 TaxID=585425 RepID=UPI001C1E7C20|nr:hypothetical protein [Synechococcus sp. KORDI-52]
MSMGEMPTNRLHTFEPYQGARQTTSTAIGLNAWVDDGAARLRYSCLQRNATTPMAFDTQDLLIVFGSFGMALFALNLYKLTKPANS